MSEWVDGTGKWVDGLCMSDTFMGVMGVCWLGIGGMGGKIDG